MSDMINIKDERFWDILFDEACVEGQQAERIEKELKKITVEPVRVEWIYWKEQCEYCMNRNTCSYPENQESMEALKQWEKENKFWGSLKLICDYYVLDRDKYYLDNPPECNAEG